MSGRQWSRLFLFVLLMVGLGAETLRAQSPRRVALVVRFGEGNVITRCVSFSEEQISGYDVLTRSGLAIVAAFDPGAGAAICSIESTGCPQESCLTCDQPNYWSYWHLVGGEWVYSQLGASTYTVHDGDVEGWSWGTGSPPPVIPFDAVCAPPTPTPTDTPLPPSPTPTATPTAPPTSTPTPPPTVPPTVTPTPSPAPAGPAPIPTPVVWFRLDENPVSPGGCTALRWNTSGALEVYLDGEPVSGNDSRMVCPAATQAYRLRVTWEGGEQEYLLVLGVVGTPPTPTAFPTAIPKTAPTVIPTATRPPTATPSPSPPPSPTVRPTATRPPSSTPTRPPTATATPFPTETAPPPATPSPKPTAAPSGYGAFAVIVAALVGLLVWRGRRR